MREMLLYLGQISTEKSLGTGEGMLIDSVCYWIKFLNSS